MNDAGAGVVIVLKNKDAVVGAAKTVDVGSEREAILVFFFSAVKRLLKREKSKIYQSNDWSWNQ